MKTPCVYSFCAALVAAFLSLGGRQAAAQTVVTTDAGLRAAIASGVPLVIIGADITLGIDDNGGVPGRQLQVLGNTGTLALEFNPGCKLRKGFADVEIFLDVPVPERSEQIFAPGLDAQGNPTFQWEPGEIRGLIGGITRRPEWWGAKAEHLGTTPTAANDDTRGINCAVGAILGHSTPNNGGHTVELGSGIYFISCPVIMTNSRCILRGKGSFGTGLQAWKNPSAPVGWRWEDHKSLFTYSRSRQFDGTGDGFDNFAYTYDHVAMIYIGGLYGITPSAENVHLKHRNPTSFGMGVYDIGLAPIPQATLGMPMSLISALARPDTPHLYSKVEENSVLQNINGSGFSAYGIGFSYYTEINGLTMRGFHMNGVDPGATLNAHPIFLPTHTGVCTVENGTVGGGDHMTDSKLDVIGIVAHGRPRISNVHIEHCHVGVDIIGWDGISAVTVNNVDYYTVNESWGNFAAIIRIRHYFLENAPAGNLSVSLTNIQSLNNNINFPILFEPGGGNTTDADTANDTDRVPSSARVLGFYTRSIRSSGPIRVGPVF